MSASKSSKFSFPRNFLLEKLGGPPEQSDATVRTRWRADVTVQVGSEHFYQAHRLVLAAYSPVFDQMFFPEAGALLADSQMEVVPLSPDDVSSISFEWILAAMYGGELDITPDNVYDLHAASNYLKIDELAERCGEFLGSDLSLTSVFSAWCYGTRNFLGSDRLKAACAAFMVENFDKFHRREEILSLPADQFTRVICRDNLKDLPENQLIQSVLTWLYRDFTNRYQHLEQVMASVDWSTADKRCNEFKVVKQIEHHEPKSDAEAVAEHKITKRLLALKETPADAGKPLFEDATEQLYVLPYNSKFGEKSREDEKEPFSAFNFETCEWERERKIFHQEYSSLGIHDMEGMRLRWSEWNDWWYFQPHFAEELFTFEDILCVRQGLLIWQYRADEVPLTEHEKACFDRVGSKPPGESDKQMIPWIQLNLERDPNWVFKSVSYSDENTGLLCVYFEERGCIRVMYLFDLRKIPPRSCAQGLLGISPAQTVHLISHKRPWTVTGCAVTLTAGHIWVIGGMKGSSTSGDVLCYDLDAGVWEDGPRLPFDLWMRRPTALLCGRMIILTGIIHHHDGSLYVHVAAHDLQVKPLEWKEVHSERLPKNTTVTKGPVTCVRGSQLYAFVELALGDAKDEKGDKEPVVWSKSLDISAGVNNRFWRDIHPELRDVMPDVALVV